MGEDSWVYKLSNKFEDLGRRFVVDDDGEVRDSAEENAIDEDVIRVLRTGVYDEPEEEETEDRDAEATVSRDDDNEESDISSCPVFASIFAFIHGAVYCLGGDIKRISEDVYVAGKAGLEIAGDFAEAAG